MPEPTTAERVKVLWVVKGLGPGGAESLLVMHARAGDHARFDYDVVYALAHKTHLVPALQGAGVGVHRLPGHPARWPAAVRRLLKAGGYDVVHVHSPALAAVVRLAVRSLPRADRPRVVATEHNEWSSFHPLTRLANAATYPFTEHGFAVSQGVLRSVWAPLRRHTELLVHGVLLDQIRGDTTARTRLRAELGVTDGQVLVITVANLREQKGYPDLLDAAAEVTRRTGRAVFAAVGQGPMEREVAERRDALGLRDRFHLLGYRSDVAELLAAADLFVLASHWEGFPIAVMEAMAAGLPVVSTRVGGLGGAVDDGVQGLLVPPGEPGRLADAVVRLVEDDATRAAMAAAAEHRGSAFDGREAVRRIDAVYAELAAGGSPAVVG